LVVGLGLNPRRGLDSEAQATENPETPILRHWGIRAATHDNGEVQPTDTGEREEKRDSGTKKQEQEQAEATLATQERLSLTGRNPAVRNSSTKRCTRIGSIPEITDMLGFINVGASDGLLSENSNELVALAQVFIDSIRVPAKPPGNVIDFDTGVL